MTYTGRYRYHLRGSPLKPPTDMNNGRFKLTLKGDEADDNLRLGDLMDQWDAVKQGLNQIDKRVARRKSPGLYYP